MKKGKIIILGIFIVGLLTSVSLAEEEVTYTLRFNTVAAPTQPQTLAMKKFAEVVDALSGGKIKVEVFHSGQLGDQKTATLAVMRGSLEMTIDTSPAWFAEFASYPEVGIFESAYLFRDLDHAYRVLAGPLGQQYVEEIAKRAGIRPLDLWYLGTRQLNLTKKAGLVRKPEDLKGIKLRMPNVPVWLDVGRALGAEPTPMAFGEVYLGLKTGTIDGQDNPLPTDEAAKFYEVTHYIVLTSHQIGFIMPAINEKLWQSMPEKYRVYIKQALMVARFYMNQMVLEQEATLLGKFEKEYGMEIIIPDKESFMTNASNFYKKYEKVWGEGMYEKIQSM